MMKPSQVNLGEKVGGIVTKPKPKLSKAAQARIDNYEEKSTLVEGRSAVRRKDNLLSLGVIIGAIVVAVALQLGYFNLGPGVPKPTPKPITAPDAALAENRVWSGAMSVAGSPIEFELYGDKAPKAVANFVSLTQKGFFENISCHRVVTKGIFVLQCGDPAGTGTGGPGYNFGPVENAPADDVYGAGILAMARQGGNGESMGSQFFIVYSESEIPSDAAGGYTVFGKVTKNLGAVSTIAEDGTADGSTDGTPKNKVLLSAISVK
jgi:peptidyl-prolyl cis-trans isomerase B (cyclophilin B)